MNVTEPDFILHVEIRNTPISIRKLYPVKGLPVGCTVKQHCCFGDDSPLQDGWWLGVRLEAVHFLLPIRERARIRVIRLETFCPGIHCLRLHIVFHGNSACYQSAMSQGISYHYHEKVYDEDHRTNCTTKRLTWLGNGEAISQVPARR